MEWVRQMSHFSRWILTKKDVANTVDTQRVAIGLEHFRGILAVFINVMVRNFRCRSESNDIETIHLSFAWLFMLR